METSPATPRSKRRSPSRMQRQKIWQKTGGSCHICGGPLPNRWVADHVKPVAEGGDSNIANFLPACPDCNRLKWHRTPDDIRYVLKLGIYCSQEVFRNSALGREIKQMFDKKSANARKRRKDSEGPAGANDG